MTKQMTKIGEAPAQPKASPEAREAPLIKTTQLTWQSSGHFWREALVRLPAGLLLQDLQDAPGVWKPIQSAPAMALRRFDRVTCIDFDESWMLKDVVVTSCDNASVTLAIRPGDKITLSGQAGEWQDEAHLIRWAGAGYACYRKCDGVEVLQGHFATIEACRSEMYRQLYSVKSR
jgi:hypothetical protein